MIVFGLSWVIKLDNVHSNNVTAALYKIIQSYSKSATCFDTEVPSSGNLRTQKFASSGCKCWTCGFVSVDSLKMALRCRNM